MYAITIKFDWQSEDADYHFLEVWGQRCGSVQRRQNPSGKFLAYCCFTRIDQRRQHAVDSVEEGKALVMSELRKYFEECDIEFTESANNPSEYLNEIKCDRCGKPAMFDENGGNCPECGDDLLIQQVAHWRSIVERLEYKLSSANKLIDRKNESLDIYLRYCESHGISGEDIQRWCKNQNENSVTTNSQTPDHKETSS